MNIILSAGRRARARAPRRARLVERHGMLQLSTGDMLRAAVKARDAGRPQGQGGDGSGRTGLGRDRLGADRRASSTRWARTPARSSTAIRAPPRRPNRSTRSLAKRGRKLDHVIELEVDEDALRRAHHRALHLRHVRRRLSRRVQAAQGRGRSATCAAATEFKRRPDDNEETVRTRMAEYRAKTAPILPIYEARGIVARRRRHGADRPGDGVDRRHPRQGLILRLPGSRPEPPREVIIMRH